MHTPLFKKNNRFKPSSFFDALVGLTIMSWLCAAWLLSLVEPADLRRMEWDQVDATQVELWIVIGSIGLSTFLSYTAWALWTGRSKPQQWVNLPSEPSSEMSRMERYLFIGFLPKALAGAGAALAVGMPLSMMGVMGSVPLWIANPLAYGAAGLLLAIGFKAILFDLKHPSQSQRWVGSVLFLSGLLIFLYPDLWTPTVFNCFTGIGLTEAPLIR